MKKVSIITVNFNQPQLTREFLQSLSVISAHPDTEVIVVDNGSAPGFMIDLSDEHPDVIFIRSEENLGFAGGNNLGIKRSTGDYLFLVNNDTEFSPELLTKLTAVLDERPEVGMVSPKILYFDERDKIQYAGFSEMNFNTGRNKCTGQFETDSGQYDAPAHRTSYVHGAAMMVRRQATEDAGLMPEDYFLYYEEMDWCEKIKKCGYQIWIEPGATIYHKESISVGKNSPLKEYYMTRNRILFIRRNASFAQRSLFYVWYAAVVTPKTFIQHILSLRFDLLKQFIRGVLWNLRNEGREARNEK